MKHLYLTIAALFAATSITVRAQYTVNGHEYVDLGLPSGTLWATCNVGATNPEDYGDYYAWGETETKDSYTWDTYKWCNGSANKLTKYNGSSDYGTVDNKTVLAPEDDVAHVKWGGGWRMPAHYEWRDLVDECTWTWTTQNGVNGYKVASKTNGNSIFLPTAGYFLNTSLKSVGSFTHYPSSSLYKTFSVWVLFFDSEDHLVSDVSRHSGKVIRPVMSKSALTAIRSINNDQLTTDRSTKSINSEAGALRYNLAGQRVGNDYKGIVIVNGKKRVMK